jgi:hypothetical protein
MNASAHDDRQNAPAEFDRIAHEVQSVGLLRELWDFLCVNKKWWLAPILVILLLFGVLVFLSGTAAAPFIYTLF